MNRRLENRLTGTDSLPGWCDQLKARTLADIVLSEKPQLVVELGVFGGRSLAALAMACQEVGHGRVVGIDPWTREAAVEGGAGGPAHNEWWGKLDLEQIYQRCLTGMKQLGVEGQVEIMRMTDEQALSSFADGSIDVLSSDANHSAVVSQRITRQWHPKLRHGAHLILDDVGDPSWPEQGEAVRMIQEELGYVDLRFVNEGACKYLIARKT